MISEANFFGGSETLTASGSPSVHPKRAHVIRNDDAGSFGTPFYRLPDVSSNANYWSRFEGRPMFIFIADGSVSIRVRKFDGTTQIALISSGDLAHVYLISAADDEWHVESRTINTARTVSKASGSTSPVAIVSATEYDPFCFFGDDCQYLIDEHDNEPSTVAVAPMYQDPNIAQNEDREPVRAADVVMPTKILIRFNDDCFEVDENHPWNGLYSLSQEFFDVLYGTSSVVDSQLGSVAQPWVLSYDAAKSGTSKLSEHPYHMHLNGTTWEHGPSSADMNVVREVWSATKTYGDDDEFTIELRFVLEHTMTARAQTGSDGGGVGDTNEYGAWGSVFSLYIFSDELNDAWVEDSTSFSPKDFDGSYTWNRENPFATGLSNAKVGTETGVEESKKGLHPQCVAAATLAMTWHAPIGQNYVPLELRETVPGSNEPGRRLNEAYVVPNGAPWGDLASCTDDDPVRYTTAGEFTGLKRNIVFGLDTSPHRAITLGGDLPQSEITEWLCWENGNGDGQSFLKPKTPGWSEDCGRLDVAGGNCATIKICTQAEDWTRVNISPCDGHPDEPLEDVGGSHRCFKNKSGDTDAGAFDQHCCVAMTSTVSIFKEYCYKTKTRYGEARPGPEDCEIEGIECESGGSFTTSFSMPIEDYSLRTQVATWVHFAGRADSAKRSLTYSGDGSDFDDDVGSWSYGDTTISPTALAGSTAVRAMSVYNPTSTWPWYGCTIETTIGDARSKSHGVGWLVELATNQATGFGVNIKPGGTNLVTVEVSVYEAGVKTVIPGSSQTISQTGTSGEVSFTMQGTHLTVTYTPSIGASYAWEGDAWISEVGESNPLARPSLYTEETSDVTGITFDDVVITDTISDLTDIVTGTFLEESISVSLSVLENLNGFGECEDSRPAGCGTFPQCNCTHTSEILQRETSASHAPNPWRDIDSQQQQVTPCALENNPCVPGSTWIGDNPTFHGGPNPFRCREEAEACPAGTPAVTDCPPPRSYVLFALPFNQESYQANPGFTTPDIECVTDTPRMCRGIDWWGVTFISCD